MAPALPPMHPTLNVDDRSAGSNGGGSVTTRPPQTSASRTVDTISTAPRNTTSTDIRGSIKLTAMARMEQRGGGGGSTSSVASTNTNTSTNGVGGGEASANTTSTSTAFAPRPSHFKDGIRLAEMGDWDILMRRLPREPQLAHHKDHHGMLPIHWACTEDDAGPEVVHALLQAFPEGVLTRNNAQYLPIHIAVRARLPRETLQLLCDARPSSLLEETPNGKTPLMLATESNLPADCINLLRRAQHAYEDPSEDEDDDRQMEDAKREIEVQSHLLRESMMYANKPMGMLRSHSNQSTATTTTTTTGSTLSVGRLQSNSVLGSFPSEARSSVSWSDQRTRELSSNLSFTDLATAATTTTNTGSTRSAPRQLPLSTVTSNLIGGPGGDASGPQPPSAVVRYMDTLMREQRPTTTTTTTTSNSNMSMSMLNSETTSSTVVPSGMSLSLTGPPPLSSRQMENFRATEGDFGNHGDSGVCGVCYKKFNMFRKKYQCKSCWVALCRKHVVAKIHLPGHKKKRSVCSDCIVIHGDDNGHGHVHSSSSHHVPSVPGHSPSFPHHTHSGVVGGSTATTNSAIVPATRLNRSGSTPAIHKPSTMGGPGAAGGMRNSAVSTNSSNAQEMRHTMAAMPSSRVSQSLRFAPAINNNDPAPGMQKPPLRLALPPSTSSVSSVASQPTPPSYQNQQQLQQPQLRALLDRFGSDTTASMTETDDRNSAEATMMHSRISTLEDQNRMLLSRLADQEKQYDDCMLLLTRTMTRVAEIEMHLPSGRMGANGSERASEDDLNPASFDFGYPLSAVYK